MKQEEYENYSSYNRRNTNINVQGIGKPSQTTKSQASSPMSITSLIRISEKMSSMANKCQSIGSSKKASNKSSSLLPYSNNLKSKGSSSSILQWKKAINSQNSAVMRAKASAKKATQKISRDMYEISKNIDFYNIRPDSSPSPSKKSKFAESQEDYQVLSIQIKSQQPMNQATYKSQKIENEQGSKQKYFIIHQNKQTKPPKLMSPETYQKKAFTKSELTKPLSVFSLDQQNKNKDKLHITTDQHNQQNSNTQYLNVNKEKLNPRFKKLNPINTTNTPQISVDSTLCQGVTHLNTPQESRVSHINFSPTYYTHIMRNKFAQKQNSKQQDLEPRV